MRGAASGRRAMLAALACILALTGCTNGPNQAAQGSAATSPAPAHATAGWTEIVAPARGARVLTMLTTGRALLAFGSVPNGSARAPAAWTTTDLQHWAPLRIRAVTGYGHVAELIMGADAAGRVVAYGQAFGGAHSNPRPTTWAGDPRRLDEHEQPYTLFGGEDAVGVSAMVASGGTTLVSGAWDGPAGAGAAAWLTHDGIRWSRIAGAAGLASARGEQTFAAGAAAAPDGFLLSGSTMTSRSTRPLAWRSTDGVHWTPIPLSATTDAQARAAACTGDGCTIVGDVLGVSQRLQCWRTDPAGAQTAASAGPGHGLVDVSQVVLTAGRALVVGAVDHVAALWSVGADCAGWSDVPTPVKTEDAAAAVFGDRVVLATTTPHGSRVWTIPAG